MKHISLLILFLLALASAQSKESLILTSFDFEQYPEVTAEFFLADSSDIPLDFTTQDFLALDNGRELNINSLLEGNKEKNVTEHHIIIIDANLSDLGGESSMLSIAKQASEDYINRLDGENESVSVISFSDVADLITDKTLDYNKAIEYLNGIEYNSSSNIDVAFKFPSTGLFDYIDRYNEQKINVLLFTKNFSDFDENIIPQLIDKNISVNTGFFLRDIKEPLKNLTLATSGYYGENIRSQNQTEDIVTAAILHSRGYSPYTVTLSDILNCDTYHEFSINLFDTLEVNTEFEVIDGLRPLLESDPGFLSFSSVLPGDNKELNVALTARNAEIFIDSLKIENEYNGIFEIVSGNVDQTIAIGPNQAHNVLIRFNPVDSAIVFTKLVVYSNACDGNEVLITGGFPNTPPNEETITVLAPECGETLIAGDTFKIEWTGVLPKDVIQLEYSTNSGTDWDTLATNVVDLEYNWEVPYDISDNCLIRAIQLWPNNIGRTLDLAHDTLLNKGTFSKDGSQVFTIGIDNKLRLWNSNTGSLVRTYSDATQGHTDAIIDFIITDDERYAITASKDTRIIVWDIESGEIVRRLLGQNQPLLDIDFTSDGNLVSVSRSSGSQFISKVIFWDFESGEMLREYNDSNLSFNDKWLLTGVETHPTRPEFVLTDLTDRGGNANVYSIDLDSDELNMIKQFDVKALNQFSTYAKFAEISPDGEYIFISESKSVNRPGLMFDYETGDFKYEITHTNRNEINSAQYFKDEENYWLLTSGGDDLAILWDVETGDSLAVFKEHTNNVTFAEFNFDGSRVLTTSWDKTAKIWNLKERDLQMDTTDCEFSISTAIINAEPLAMGEVVVRRTADSTFTQFIFNESTFDYDVYDIRIEGPNADEFTILEGFGPFSFENKTYRTLNVAFTPQDVGLRQAEIIVEYPSNTKVIPLSGIGIDPGIQQLTTIIDFGEVQIGDYLTIEDIDLILNTSSQTVEIDSIIITGIERDFFSYSNMLAPSQLDTDGILSGNIRFTPLEIASFAATMRIYHSAPTSPSNILLTAQGAPQRIDTLSLALGSDIADPGEIIDIPLFIASSTLDMVDKSHSISFDLTFDKTVLEPLGDYVDIQEDAFTRTVNYTLPLTEENITNGIAGELQFRIALGMDSISRLSISNLTYEGDSKVLLSASNGEVKVASLCEEGGLRLFDARGAIKIGTIAPNPVIASSTVGVELIESAETKIYILDYQGKIVELISNGFMDSGYHQIDLNTATLPQGAYQLIIQTKFDTVRSSFVVSK